MTKTGNATAIRMRPDGAWMAVPLDAEADADAEAAQREVADFVGRFPSLSPLTDRFVEELVTCAGECRTRGVRAAAFSSQVGEDGRLLEGWLEVGQADRLGSPDDDLAGSLAASAADDTRPRVCEQRDLPAGSAVRVRGARDVGIEGTADGYVVEYLEYWFLDAAGERAVVVSAMTPSVGRSDQFVDSVDELVETLTISW